jgi:hypothetical protein
VTSANATGGESPNPSPGYEKSLTFLLAVLGSQSNILPEYWLLTTGEGRPPTFEGSRKLLENNVLLEAEVGIERGSPAVPSLTHSVSTLIVTLFYKSSSHIFDRSLNARSLPAHRLFIAR